MTTALPHPAEALKTFGVSLAERQVAELDALALQSKLSRSELIRWVIDLALPIARAEVARSQSTKSTADRS